MNRQQAKHIAKAICELVPELRTKGRLLAVAPRGRILRGIYLETSGSADVCYVWAFVQPLYVPQPTIVFNLGKRLRGRGEAWNVHDPSAIAVAARHDGRPFFGRVSSATELADWDELTDRSDAWALEPRAYSLVACGRFTEGARLLRELAGILGTKPDWEFEMRERAEELADLAERDPDRATDLLNKWEAATAAKLGVEGLP